MQIFFPRIYNVYIKGVCQSDTQLRWADVLYELVQRVFFQHECMCIYLLATAITYGAPERSAIQQSKILELNYQENDSLRW